VGLLGGFLFGIPRSVPVGAGPDDHTHGSHAVNTKLEQISDWLTKILIGIGLVELARISGYLDALVHEVGDALGGDARAGSRPEPS
jgi:hypothetical protein